MNKQLTCLVVVMALGAACTQQSSQQQPRAGAQGAAAAPASSAAAPSSDPAQPARSPAAAFAASAAGTRAAPPKRTLKAVTIPSGTAINVTLDTAVASETSKAEDPVRGKLSKPVVVDGTIAVPEGSEIFGMVTEAKGSGRVRGRASVAFTFDKLSVRDERLDIRTSRFARKAASTKGKDAEKIGIGAGAGAVIGALAGGKKGAAIGGAVGAGAGTGVVMATKGEEVHLAPGTALTVRLQGPLKVLVPID